MRWTTGTVLRAAMVGVLVVSAASGATPPAAAAETDVDCATFIPTSDLEATLGTSVLAVAVSDLGSWPGHLSVACSWTFENGSGLGLEVYDLDLDPSGKPFLIEKYSGIGSPVRGVGVKAYGGWNGGGGGLAWAEIHGDIDRLLVLDGAPLEQLITLARGSTARTIAASNRPPVAAGDTFRIPTGGTLRLNAPGVLKNDRDPDGDRIVAAWGAHSTLSVNTHVEPDGSLTIRFPKRWNGKACLAYRAIDPSGASSAPAFVRITVGEPSGEWAQDRCASLEVEATAAAPAIVPAKARSGYHWEYLWTMGGPNYSGFYHYARHWCLQSQGRLFIRWGRFWSRYSCWRWGPYQTAY